MRSEGQGVRVSLWSGGYRPFALGWGPGHWGRPLDRMVGLPTATPHGKVVGRQAVYRLRSLPAMVVDDRILAGVARATLSCLPWVRRSDV